MERNYTQDGFYAHSEAQHVDDMVLIEANII